MKTLLITCFIVISASVYAQNYTYCTVNFHPVLAKAGYAASVDYGDNTEGNLGRDIKVDDVKLMHLSYASWFNYFATNGWELLFETTVPTMPGENPNKQCFVFRKKIV